MITEQTTTFPGRLLLVTWNLIQVGILLYGLIIAGFLIGRNVIGERWDSIAYANNFIPWWALGSVILVGIALFSSRRWLLISVQIPAILAFALLYGDQWLATNNTPDPLPDSAIRVATFNVISISSDPQRISDVIKSLDADLIGIEELGPVHADQFARDLSDVYPYQALHPLLPVHGVGLLSRFPILEEEVIRPLPDSMLCMRALVDMNGVQVTVYVVHPSPPQNVLIPVTYDDSRRDTELSILYNEYLRHETGPLIVVGDFNMTDQSDAYHQIDDLLYDSFRQAGHGMGFTFPDQIHSTVRLLPLLLRIDYVWHDNHFTAYRAYVGSDSGTSDHRPVVAELSLDQGLVTAVRASD
jgi:vancomycin resistance protein VanJ